jgi:hypothetical protein
MHVCEGRRPVTLVVEFSFLDRSLKSLSLTHSRAPSLSPSSSLSLSLSRLTNLDHQVERALMVVPTDGRVGANGSLARC